VCSHLFNNLLEAGGSTDKARLLAGCAWSSGSWLHALPSAPLGLHFGDEEVWIAVGLRLGSQLVVPHSCTCGVMVASDGLHGLSCRRSAGRLSRHAAVNDVTARAFHGVNVPTLLEPTGLIRGDGKCPDCVTLIPWSHGRCLLWDFACPDWFAPTHLSKSSLAAGSAASVAEARKRAKYSALSAFHIFVSVDVETSGVWGAETTAPVRELRARIVQLSMRPSLGFVFAPARCHCSAKR